jgi:hypothetical protein
MANLRWRGGTQLEPVAGLTLHRSDLPEAGGQKSLACVWLGHRLRPFQPSFLSSSSFTAPYWLVKAISSRVLAC